MDARTETQPTAGDIITELAGMVAGLGMLTLVLFPFALPAIALAALAVVPLVLALLVALVAFAVAAPFVLVVRALRRRNADPVSRDGAVLRAASSARAVQP